MVGYLPGTGLGLDPTPPPPAVPFSSRVPGKEGPSKVRACLVRVVVPCALAGGMIMVLFVVWLLCTTAPHFPRYSVAIDSFSGLASNRTDLALDPEFNLTLRVVSTTSRHGDDACVEPGTYVVVSYRCITLATSATAQHRLCAAGEPGKAAEQRLVARGTGVRVPGTVLDSLAADVRQGQGGPVFEVTVRWSGRWYTGDVFVAACGGRRVGAGHDDLGASCDPRALCP